ncbi:MAG: GNAT family N-acetyltransferase [Chloroflexi bacterium]|nr:GNAT family N-acetyltransferase [Chloroflexota bacterium]
MNYHSLTGQQRRILELLAAGKTNKEIAAILHISENTVEYHLVKRIYPLLQVRNRSAAASVYFKLATKALRKSVVDTHQRASTIDPSAANVERRRKEMPSMNFTLKSVESEDELKQVYAFATAVLGLPTAKHTLAYYDEQLDIAPQLMVYALRQSLIVGCGLASIEADHVLVGPVAVAESARRMGLGTALLAEIERQASALGQHTLILGALEEAENFYLHCGYQPHLFVQYPEPAYVSQLKALNQHYAVAWEAQEDGWSKLMLRTPKIDKALQASYERQFPNCATQTVFIKTI